MRDLLADVPGERLLLDESLCQLVDALEQDEAPVAVQQYRREALTLLDDFTDPSARRLRERLTNALGEGS
ncbi:hypothetical protein ABZW10_14970 [Kitasatospora sp. NPDC004723]|uniref:hypothetical protein n=1 Tax=Kitasatospora sp. NPDC004723 TaxID=3154288 RepID=UPI0033A65344